eukprot:4481541-Lingulodinium_polyedra.AAC.1
MIDPTRGHHPLRRNGRAKLRRAVGPPACPVVWVGRAAAACWARPQTRATSAYERTRPRQTG